MYRYAGPASEMLSFDMPEDVPEPVVHFEAFPMGSSALFLKWTRPAKPNGILTGYKIRYQVVYTDLDKLFRRKPHVMDPQATSAKLSALAPDTRYSVSISATTRVGESLW
jgi:neuronal cell adhesion molecule